MPRINTWHCGKKDDHPGHHYRRPGKLHGQPAIVRLWCPGGPFKPQGKNPPEE
jgi:hypothetical protein